MKIAIPKERRAFECRVAAIPETVKKMIAMGHQVIIEQDAGVASSISDAAFEKAGAYIALNYTDTVKDADIILKVQRPLTDDEGNDEISSLSKNTTLIGLLAPYQNRDRFRYAEHGINAVALEMMPRITRAQSMDVLSSQANLAGYQAVIEACYLFDRAFPMMMTAAGTIPPARVLILGAGVAGLQAIATAKRLGAIVSAFDVRDAAKEQVESLGATFISVQSSADSNTSKDDGRGYAQKMSQDYQMRQADLIHNTLKTNDIIITTAQIPGIKAPVLITENMVNDMKEGSIIIDLAIESGGNCALSQVNHIINHKGIKIVGHANMPSRIAQDASSLYARNVFNFLKLLVPQDAQHAQFNFDDQIIKDVTLTQDGKVIHETFQN